jgi:hypothetical protein
MTKTVEIWKNITGYEGLYKISSYGRVMGKHKEDLKGWYVNGNYVKVRLYKDRVAKDFYVHRLVAKHFLIEIPNKNLVNHIDHNPMNNNVTNLEWCTQKENMVHAKNHNRMNTNGRNVVHIPTNKIYKSIKEASLDLGMKPNTLVCRLRRNAKKCDFKYLN